MHWSFRKIPKAKLMCWLAFTPSCSWRPIFPLSRLTAHWAPGAGVTVHLNLLYSFIILWLFHGTVFLWHMELLHIISQYFPKSWMSVFLSEIQVSLAKGKMQVHMCCKGIQSCHLICSFYSSLWAAGVERKGARGMGSGPPLTPPHWVLVLHSLRSTPYLNSTLHCVLVP